MRFYRLLDDWRIKMEISNVKIVTDRSKIEAAIKEDQEYERQEAKREAMEEWWENENEYTNPRGYLPEGYH